MTDLSLTRPKRIEIPPEWSQVSFAWAIAMISRTWLLIAFAFALPWILANVWGWILGVLLAGVAQNHLIILTHSGQHWQLFKNRKLNDFVGMFFLTGPLGVPFARLRRAHLDHHRFLGTDREHEDEDRFYYGINENGRGSALAFINWIVGMFTGYAIVKNSRKIIGKVFAPKHDENIDTKSSSPTHNSLMTTKEFLGIATSQLLLFALAYILTGVIWAYFILWGIPRLTIGPGLNALRTTLDHADPDDPPSRLKSFVSNRVERFIIAPFNMNYHCEHHLWMGVTAPHLPKLRKVMLENVDSSQYRMVDSYFGNLIEIIRKLHANRMAPGDKSTEAAHMH